MNHSSIGTHGLIIAAFIGCASFALGMPPPKPQPKVPPADNRPTVDVVLTKGETIRWELDRNIVTHPRSKKDDQQKRFRCVDAVDVRLLEPKSRKRETQNSDFGIWLKKFDDPELRDQNFDACVIDENVFTELRIVNASYADELKLDGTTVGRVKLEKYKSVELVKFLVMSGIVDANTHVIATITGTHFTSEAGDWFTLHSDDPFVTSVRVDQQYDFGIHIAKDGTIRVINPKHVGKLLKNQEVKQ